MTCEERNRLLALPDDELVSLCRVDAFRASGRGGQKVNKTSSGIRVTHKSTDISAESTEYRSQALNKHEALKRLKTSIALKIRCVPDENFSLDGNAAIPAQNSERRALFRAQILDAAEENDFDFAATAEKLKCTRSALAKIFERDEILMRYAREREAKKKSRGISQSSKGKFADRLAI